MLTKLLTEIFSKGLIILVLSIIIPMIVNAQEINPDSIVKSHSGATDSITINDIKILLGDSIKNGIISGDSIIETHNDGKEITVSKPRKSSSMNLIQKVIYNAEDSIIMDWVAQKAYMYRKAEVDYDGINLKADYIELDFKNNTVYAIGVEDSTGKVIGSPIFKDGKDEFETTSLTYNFDTRVGIVNNVTKHEGDMYVWLSKGKKMSNNITYVKSGHFTTCSAPHPHYRIRYKKGKVIPDDKIVTGPIYMEVEDIPIPLIVPFGFIPNKKGRANGILFPSYGYTENRGYNLTDGGYYWGLGPNMDLALRGDIYSRGSWGLKAHSRYNFRYRGQGDFDIKYAHNKIGETDANNYTEDQSFFIRWNHRQDAKANPNSSFSADVNFGSTNYNNLNSNNTQDYLTNTFHSSIAYRATLWDGYNFTANLGHNQNSQTGAINMTLPQISFSTPRFYPFKKKKPIGKKKWYEKVMISYKMDAKNNLSTVDSLFGQVTFEDFDKGIRHVVPLSSTVNLGKFTWTNSANFTERWYFQSTYKNWEDTTYIDNDTILPHLNTDYHNEFSAIHEYSFNSAINTRIYGMYIAKKGPIKALRHVVSPNLGFSYHPDFGASHFNYFTSYTDKNGKEVRYSRFAGQMYGAPPDGKSGSVNLSIDNNFELKVRSRKDTITGTKKIKLIESLRIGTSYDIAKTEFQLAPLSLTARTTIVKGLSVRFAGYWDFYALDSAGVRINEFNWDVNKRLLRRNSSEWNFGFNYNINSNKQKKKKQNKYQSDKGTQEELEEVNTYPDHYVDFNNPWNMNFSYTWRYTNIYNYENIVYDKKIIQTLGLRGDVNITKKWKIGITTGWDFQANELSFTSVDIYRDLHCWELMFNWIPIGNRKSYNLTIRVKSPMLQDLKLNKRKDWRDY
ncbi:MAG: LPS-assembly protein LptD [Bacteroidales bacterium]|nr:LPS-assembly protein LptD [Bacteroidales bacterium]